MKKRFSCIVTKIQDCPFRIPFKYDTVDNNGVSCKVEVYCCGYNMIVNKIAKECTGTFSDEPSLSCPLDDYAEELLE